MAIPSSIPVIPARPITFEAIEPYGDLIEGSWDPSTMPKRIKTNVIRNPQTAFKYNRLAPITSSYPVNSLAQTTISVYRATPPAGIAIGSSFDLRMFERHSFTSQAFLPMARGDLCQKSIKGSAGGMVVVVALNGEDDKPDLRTLRVFLLSASQGISYNAGVWHHSVLSLSPVDYACIDTQITQDSSIKADCEVVRRNGAEEDPWARIYIPE